eukprot:TRINITY_DN2617_c0_g1_i1.p1 TRINITY_DN2617_c0_g1~~TRINITY_DN2617_c0_g1_i1.p1  ORF type:complete len:856 (+),score=108.29 TRINITY_DN2617_c0_g1_i1:69-2636(+)
MSGIGDTSDHGEEKGKQNCDQQHLNKPETEQEHDKPQKEEEDKPQTDEKSTDTKEEKTDDSKPAGKKKGLLHYTCKMVSDLLLVGFLVSNLFSYVLNTDDTVKRKTRRPEPFFSDSSLVRDYWEGDVFQAFKDAQHFESSFFMFYAAWDRESQESRQILDSVALYYRNSDVMIGAVNCWYPTSDCAKEFGGKNGTGHILPVFIFYPSTMNGIQYRGHVTTADIIRFMSWSRWPVVHLHSTQHLQSLQVEYENVLVGYLPNTNHFSIKVGHKDLLAAALEFHEVLPEKPVCTAVVTSDLLAKQLHLHATKPVKLYTHNTTFTYPNKTIDGEKVVYWTIKNVTPTSAWLNLLHKKSYNLKRVFEGGSGNVLLLFSPRPQLFQDQAYDMLRQVSMEYFNCDKSDATSNLVARLKERTRKSSESCTSQSTARSGESPSSTPSVVTSSSIPCQVKPWSLHAPQDSFPACGGSSTLSSVAQSACYRRYYGPNNGTNSRENSLSGGCSLVHKNLNTVDPNVQLLLQEVEIENKNGAKLSSGGEGVFSNDKSKSMEDVTGLGCSSNKTLRFYRVDSAIHSTLLERFGLEDRRSPVPVILNNNLNNIHVKDLRRGHVEEDLRSMIVSWHRGTLSDSAGHRSTHKESVIRYRVDLTEKDKPDSVIRELSAATFSEVESSTHDTVLFITSSFCTDCTVASQLFHSAKLHLEHIPSLRFLMIDGTRNDLKWEYNTFSYPAILFFPRNRSDASRVFPSTELSLPALLKFILSNLRPVQRVAANLATCDKFCLQKFRIECESEVTEVMKKLRTHTTLPLQVRHKFTRKLMYTKKLLSLVNQLHASHSKEMEGEKISEEKVEHFLVGDKN